MLPPAMILSASKMGKQAMEMNAMLSVVHEYCPRCQPKSKWALEHASRVHSVGTLTIRIRFWGILYYNSNKKSGNLGNNNGNYLGPL